MTKRALARSAGITPVALSNIEHAKAGPRVSTLVRLLEACGATLVAEPRRGQEVERGPIREHLRLAPVVRPVGGAGFDPRRMMKVLLGGRVDMVVTGDVGANILGSPIRGRELQVVLGPERNSRVVLAKALKRLGVDVPSVPRARRMRFTTRLGPLVVVTPPADAYRMLVAGSWVVDPRWQSPWLPDRPLRVPSIDDLIEEARAERRWERLDALWALREVLDGLLLLGRR